MSFASFIAEYASPIEWILAIVVVVASIRGLVNVFKEAMKGYKQF